MASVKYSQEHEWISVEGDVGTIGNLGSEDPIPEMLMDLSRTLKRELGFEMLIVKAGKN